jgi:predicted DNA binding CopG/RHH family protein
MKTASREDRVRVVTAFEPIKTAHSVLLPGTREVIHMAKKQPPFKTEAQESEWWAKNQNLIADRFEQAKATGKLGKGTVAQVARERAIQAGASPTITIRLAEDDLARARAFASEKGLRYQTYLKMLLHQALNSEEKRRDAGSPG